MWRYGVQQCVKWDAMRDSVVRCIMWPIWCDLKYGIAKWNSVLREMLVRYEMCDMVRNVGVTWNVVWFGIMSEMALDVE